MVEKSWVSILIPVFKVENYIERCVRSAFEQTYPNIEYIFCDDCSPDRSMEVLERMIKDYPERAAHVRIIRFPENKGLATVRNTLVDACQTEWLLHLDSDDWMERDAVEGYMECQSRTDADIVCADLIKHYAHGENQILYIRSAQKEDYFQCILYNNMYHNCWGKLIRTALYREHHVTIPEDCKKAEDWRVIIQLFHYADKIVTLPKVTWHYDDYRPERISAVEQDNIERKYNDHMSSFQFVMAFLKEKRPDLIDIYSNTMLERMIQYATLSVCWGNREIHKRIMGDISTFRKQYPHIPKGIKNQLVLALKSNYFCYRLFLRSIS